MGIENDFSRQSEQEEAVNTPKPRGPGRYLVDMPDMGNPPAARPQPPSENGQGVAVHEGNGAAGEDAIEEAHGLSYFTAKAHDPATQHPPFYFSDRTDMGFYAAAGQFIDQWTMGRDNNHDRVPIPFHFL